MNNKIYKPAHNVARSVYKKSHYITHKWAYQAASKACEAAIEAGLKLCDAPDISYKDVRGAIIEATYEAVHDAYKDVYRVNSDAIHEAIQHTINMYDFSHQDDKTNKP